MSDRKTQSFKGTIYSLLLSPANCHPVVTAEIISLLVNKYKIYNGSKKYCYPRAMGSVTNRSLSVGMCICHPHVLLTISPEFFILDLKTC